MNKLTIYAVPPSTNTYWRTSVKGKRAIHYISQEGKHFREQVHAVAQVENLTPILGPCKVSIVYCVSKNRRKDVDNILKGLLDALEGCLFANDSQVMELSVQCKTNAGEDKLEVEVEEMP